MKPKKLILTLIVLSIAALTLAACDATGAVPLNELIGENQTTDNAPLNSTDAKSSSKMEDSPDTSTGEEIKLTGMVEEVTENSITINGTTFSADSTLDLTTAFQVGMAYEIEYYLNADGSITLKKFSLEDSSSDDMSDMDEMEFKGMLEAVTETTLTFDGVTYTVDTMEDLTTLFMAGQMYEIEYYLNADGTITLKDFSLEDTSVDVYDDSNDDMSDDDQSDDSYNNSDDNYDDDSYNDSNDSYDNNYEDSSNNLDENNYENDSNNDNNYEENNNNND